jgi:hypothetical protein
MIEPHAGGGGRRLTTTDDKGDGWQRRHAIMLRSRFIV